MDRQLKSIFTHHKGKLSDKWSLYLDVWDTIFKPYQNREINLLEIGTQNGGSLEIFAKYFLNAQHIIGCDIEENCQNLKFNDPRITVITGNITSDAVENRIAELAPELDIIIDDGSHHSRDIIISFCRYFRRLANHGLYIIEDLHTSYWGDYDGGLYQPYTAMAFFKRLVDITNFEHWQNNRSRQDHLVSFTNYYDVDFDEFNFFQIHSIKFINSLCIISKRPPEENALGKRMIVGEEESISNGYRKFDGTSIHDLPKGASEDAQWDVFTLIDRNEKLETRLSEREETIQQLQDTVIQHEQSIQVLSSEVSQKEQTIHLLEKNLIDQDQFIQKLDATIVEQTLKISDLDSEISKSEQHRQHLENEVNASHQQIHQYQENLATLNQQVQDLKNEILFYALSNSWRFTRPLRKIMGFLRGEKHA